MRSGLRDTCWLSLCLREVTGHVVNDMDSCELATGDTDTVTGGTVTGGSADVLVMGRTAQAYQCKLQSRRKLQRCKYQRSRKCQAPQAIPSTQQRPLASP